MHTHTHIQKLSQHAEQIKPFDNVFELTKTVYIIATNGMLILTLFSEVQ